jgi:large subunit ribosomal protein L25
MATKIEKVPATKRAELGSRANKRLRDKGELPGVIYGHKEAVVPIKMNRKEVVTHLNRGAHLFELQLDGSSENVLIKDVQYDALGIDVLHVDFTRVDLHERVTLTLALELKGEPKGEKEGAVLQQVMSELEVECLVTEIPDRIVQDVSHMEKDSVLHISDLKLPPGVKVLNDPELIVCQVREVREEVVAPAAAAAAAEEGAAEPEVIGKKKEDEEAAGAAAGEEKK